jgi:hypothetical protein
MLRSLLICLSFLIHYGTSLSQVTITGTILDEITQQPVAGIKISTSLPDQAISDADGRFSIHHEENDWIILQITINGETTEYQIRKDTKGSIEVGYIVLKPSQDNGKDVELPSISLEEEDDQLDANISGLLQSGQDLFGRMTSYTFSPARFKRRGLDSEYNEGYLNHLPINNLETGGVYWSNWGGLNDVMRQDAEVVGAEIAESGFGGVASTFNTDLRASSQWRQARISYAVTNRNYRNRIAGTWSTGMLSSGWAISLSGSRRWSQEGYIQGTYYDAWSYFASIEKKLNDRHSLNLVVLGSPYERGGNSTSTQEMYDLAKSNYYNSFWGYQQGEKRSARIFSGHQPLLMLRHDFIISDKLSLITAVGYESGRNTVEALDWLNANDPRPDYYRRLPSYVDDPALAQQMTDLLTENDELLQIQWDKLYSINLNSQFEVENADGIEGNTVAGALSRYVMEERRNETDKKSGNIVLEYLLNDRSQIRLGINAVIQNTRNYKILGDLLGGEFYVDWDKFAEQDFPGNEDAQQNDLRRPNRIVREGDQFGYDFYSKIRQQSTWLSYQLETKRWEFGISGSVKNHIYWRDGKVQNGKFPDNSYGDSEKNEFFLPSAKALLRYKIDGRNYVTVSGMVSEMAPTFRNAYVSPRTRNSVVDGLETESLNLGEIRYDLRSPDLKISLAGYYITSKNGIESTSFYHDDERTFVNFSLTDIDKEYTGIEAAINYKLIPGLSVQGAAAVGQYIYTSRPNATITQDNDGSVLQQDITIYAKNLYVSGTPQSAYTAGITYSSKKFWSLYLNINRFQESWINFNPLRRTSVAVDLVEYPSEQLDAILTQEKVDPAWTVDLSFFKSWRVDWVKERAIFAINLGVTNLLDNQDYINGGYEQYRFDFENKDVNKFPSRYSYMQGLNYFVQASLRL